MAAAGACGHEVTFVVDDGSIDDYPLLRAGRRCGTASTRTNVGVRAILEKMGDGPHCLSDLG